MNCEICNGTGWKVTEAGAKRCECRQQEKPPRRPIASDALAAAVEALGALAYYPREPKARTMVGDALAAMCGSVEELRYVVRRAIGLYKTWDECGVPGLRQIQCARYRPADGIEAGPTPMFPEGLPSEVPQIAGPERKLLPAGKVGSADDGADRALSVASQVMRMKSADFKGPATKEEIAAAPDWLKKLDGYEL